MEQNRICCEKCRKLLPLTQFSVSSANVFGCINPACPCHTSAEKAHTSPCLANCPRLKSCPCPCHATDTVEKKCPICGRTSNLVALDKDCPFCYPRRDDIAPTTDTSDWRKPSWLQKEFQINYVNAVSLKNLIEKELERARAEGRGVKENISKMKERAYEEGRTARDKEDFGGTIAYIEFTERRFQEGRADERARLREKIAGMKKEIVDNWQFTHDRDADRFTRLTKEEKGYNAALTDILTHLSDTQN